MRKLHTTILIVYILLILVYIQAILALPSAYAISEERKIQNMMNPFKKKLPVTKKEPAPVQQPQGITRPRTPPSAPENIVDPMVDDPSFEDPSETYSEDPSQPPLMPEITVTGVIWDTDKPQAIINGEVKEINDSVSFLKVTHIDKTGVQLKAADGRTMSVAPGGN